MPARLQEDIRQTKPFASLEEEAFLNVLRTAGAMLEREAALLKEHGLTHAQYNALRILRGAGEKGLACGEIADRMITRDPDVTRLLDRLEKQRWIKRSRQRVDRRVVMARITAEGLARIEPLDRPVDELMRGVLGHLGEERLRMLIRLLEEARSSAL